MSQTWELQFTTQFEKDVKKLKKSGNFAWLDGLNVLKKGIQSNNNLKQLKGYSKGFRWRNGDIRVIFRILEGTREILLMSAGYRKDVYKKKATEVDPTFKIFDQLLKKQRKKEPVAIKQAIQKKVSNDISHDESKKNNSNTENYFIEEIFVDVADLYLLNIDDRYHEELLECHSIGDISRNNDVPEDICNLIEDYLTSPSAHHIGRIYTLDNSANIESIAQQPLSSFLVKLDPQQKQIVNKPLCKSPLLIRGGPGTGKTLIHLARIKRVIEEKSESGAFSNKIKIGFVTYNKTLSQTASSVFKEISSKNSLNSIEPEFKTFDSIVFQLGQQIQSTSATIISEREQKEALGFVINSCTDEDLDKNYLMDVISRRGQGYILEEFEQVLLGNDLLDIDSYLSFSRKGRKIGLPKKERKLIFSLFKKWFFFLKNKNQTTFSLRRLKVLRELNKGTLNIAPYDYIFVDELQDLSVVCLRIISKIVSHPNNLTFTADTAQAIYLKSPSWSNISPDLKFNSGNSFILQSSYRMTKEIAKAINPLRANSGDDEIDDGINNPIFNGERPNWVVCNEGIQLEKITMNIQKMIEKSNVNANQIAVIVPDKKSAEATLFYAGTKNIKAKIISRDFNIQLNTDSIHILTAHAAKGLEFPFVFVSSVSSKKYPQPFALKNCLDEQQKSEELDRSKRLLYVALSRAARGLWMFVDRSWPSDCLAMLNQKDWEVELI